LLLFGHFEGPGWAHKGPWEANSKPRLTFIIQSNLRLKQSRLYSDFTHSEAFQNRQNCPISNFSEKDVLLSGKSKTCNFFLLIIKVDFVSHHLSWGYA
jgi:hypothetical protein